MINRNIKINIFIPLLIFAFFAQITFMPQFFQNYTPNLILIILLAGSIVDRSALIFYISFIVGFVFEIFSDAYFGSIIISMMSMVFIVSVLGALFLKKIFSYHLYLFSVIGVLTYNIIYIIWANLYEIQKIIPVLNQLFYIIIVQLIFTIIVIYPLTYFILRKNEE